jgi:hypothetical protein
MISLVKPRLISKPKEKAVMKYVISSWWGRTRPNCGVPLRTMIVLSPASESRPATVWLLARSVITRRFILKNKLKSVSLVI